MGENITSSMVKFAQLEKDIYGGIQNVKKELSKARVDILDEAEQIIKPERIAKMEMYIKNSIKQLDSLENKVKSSETKAI